MDAGDTAEHILAALDRVSGGLTPQPLVYLVNDTARQHGRIRGGPAGCYLRCDDAALLAEAVADSRLRSFGLRLVAPGVLVGLRPLAETLAGMRAAGYSPIEEGGDGAVVLVREALHRTGSVASPAEVLAHDVATLDQLDPEVLSAEMDLDLVALLDGDGSGTDRLDADGFSADGFDSDGAPGDDAAVDLTMVDVAHALLQLPDRRQGTLYEFRGTVVDSGSIHEVMRDVKRRLGES